MFPKAVDRYYSWSGLLNCRMTDNDETYAAYYDRATLWRDRLSEQLEEQVPWEEDESGNAGEDPMTNVNQMLDEVLAMTLVKNLPDKAAILRLQLRLHSDFTLSRIKRKLLAEDEAEQTKKRVAEAARQAAIAKEKAEAEAAAARAEAETRVQVAKAEAEAKAKAEEDAKLAADAKARAEEATTIEKLARQTWCSLHQSIYHNTADCRTLESKILAEARRREEEYKAEAKKWEGGFAKRWDDGYSARKPARDQEDQRKIPDVATVKLESLSS